jgi:peptidoglycan/xylan/chitin deacetylase (PgdA/CDA1 family)
MRKTNLFLILAAFLCRAGSANTEVFGQSASPVKGETARPFQWPDGKRMALSLSFDDARPSQIDTGLAILRKHGVKVTFFLQGNQIEKRLDGWRQAATEGHELGNHSLTHPCTGNYEFSRHNALEDYSLPMMEKQLDAANAQINRLLGIKPKTFAYPCGQKFVGRGRHTKSYIPLVVKRFLVGRGYLDEAANDPAFCDLAQVLGTPSDDMDFEQLLKLIEQARKQGRWIIFVGHEIGSRGYQVTDTRALEALCDYANDPANEILLGTVSEIGEYIQKHRAAIK